MKLSPSETTACQTLIALALAEDLGTSGDATSHTLLPADATGNAILLAKADGICAGIDAARLVFSAVDPKIAFEATAEDGLPIKKGDRLGVVSGPLRGILSAERVALNFLQHLSGIATLTRRYVDAVAGTSAKILDTRKTLPGWRLLQKYAVRCGGGHNHRLGLFDGILVKDNHLAALAKTGRAADLAALLAARPTGLFLEIEIDSLSQLDDVCRCGPDMILLDNMDAVQMRQAVTRRNQLAPQVLLEASGGVNLATVRSFAETGVDRISVGALTHSAPALDISLEYEI